MKTNRLICHLLLAFGVVLSSSFYHTAKASFAGLYLQDPTGGRKKPPPGGQGTHRGTANPGNSGQMEPGGTGNGVNSNNGNSQNNGNSNQHGPSDVVSLAQQKASLEARVDNAFQRAQIAARNTKNGDANELLKELTAQVNNFRMSIGKAEIGQLQAEATAQQIENTSWQIEAKSQPPQPSTLLTYGNIASTLSLLLALVTLGGLLFMFSGLRIRLDQLEDARQRSSQAMERLRQSLDETKKYAESVGANLSRVQDDLGLRIESARRSSEEAKKLARAVEFAPASSVEPLRAEVRAETIDPEPSFPATVAEYLNHINGNRKKGVEADFRTNLLVLAMDGSAPFTFVEDADGSGAGIILPRQRLQRSQEFASLYKGYYYCTEPSAGEVYIIEPAVVERDGSGWRLSHPGRMEIH